MSKIGRPEFSNKKYEFWVNEMSPFLKAGFSLYSSIEKAGLLKHKDSIYKKYRLNDWFCEKIEAFQRYPAEIVNSIFTQIVMCVHEKIKAGNEVSETEMRNVRFFAEKHRSCQIYFSNSTETLSTNRDNIGRLLDNLVEETDYEYLADKARENIVKTQKAPLPVRLNPLQA